MPSAAAAVADALRYVGHPYVWGGWDCSGFMNHVLGQDLGLAIPGYPAGAYTGPPPHGPVVSDYLAWAGAVTVPGPPAAGDLVCYPPDVHIGMAVSASRFVSALDPQLGTRVSAIAGGAVYRRVTALSAAGPVPVTAPGGSSSVLVRVLLVAVAALAAVVSAAGPEAALAWAASRRRVNGDF